MCPFLLEKEMGKRKVVPKFNARDEPANTLCRNVAP
jgi:hypothetical protein